MKIYSEMLTTCSVAGTGKSIKLNFLDHTGAIATLELPFEQAQAIAMTLPHLLSQALKVQTGDSEARYVFPLGEWSVARASDQEGVVLTLSTEDGFAASFSAPVAACRGLGQALAAEADGQSDPALSIHIVRH